MERQAAHDEGSAPAEVDLGEGGIGVDVVPHVQYVIPLHAQRGLHHASGPPAEEAPLGRAHHWPHQPIWGHDLVEAHVVAEEVRLASLHYHL